MTSRRKYVKRSRRGDRAGQATGDSTVEVEMAEATHFSRSEYTFDMDQPAERVRLIRKMWSGEYRDAVGMQAAANPELAELLRQLTTNGWKERQCDSEHHAFGQSLTLEGMLSDLCRWQSQKQMPLWTALNAVQARRYQCSEPLWDCLRLMHPGVLPTVTWTDKLIADAVQHNPGCPYAEIPRVAAVIFDNYQRQCKYKSLATTESSGYMLDMTNWGKFSIPLVLQPPGFDPVQICTPISCLRLPSAHAADPCACTVRKPFRTDLSFAQFTSSFLVTNPEILANKAERFATCLRKTAAGTLFDRPDHSANWKPHIVFGPPMFGVLQSKNVDVEYEMDFLKGQCRSAMIMFAGGDGLSLMRMNSIIAADPEYWLDTSPMIIPVQGEHPHGTDHVHHADWRMFWPLIEACANHLGNKQAVKDPNVTDFNKTWFFRLVLTRAVAEYVNEMAAAGGPSTDLAVEFVRASEKNVDLAWLVHWLYDGAFLCLQWKREVRGDGGKLDLLWREFVGLARTDAAHKTQYAPMAVLRVFWGKAMVQPLNDLYHRIRTLPMGKAAGTSTGWDQPCEELHRSISLGVPNLVSEERIARFIQEYPFTATVANGLRQVMYEHRADPLHKLKDMDADVQKLKEFFRRRIGKNWAEASKENTIPKLVGAGARGTPWEAVLKVASQTGRDSVHEWVRRQVHRNASFFTWKN